jgi:hypothetical protein
MASLSVANSSIISVNPFKKYLGKPFMLATQKNMSIEAGAIEVLLSQLPSKSAAYYQGRMTGTYSKALHSAMLKFAIENKVTEYLTPLSQLKNSRFAEKVFLAARKQSNGDYGKLVINRSAGIVFVASSQRHMVPKTADLTLPEQEANELVTIISRLKASIGLALTIENIKVSPDGRFHILLSHKSWKYLDFQIFKIRDKVEANLIEQILKNLKVPLKALSFTKTGERLTLRTKPFKFLVQNYSRSDLPDFQAYLDVFLPARLRKSSLGALRSCAIAYAQAQLQGPLTPKIENQIKRCFGSERAVIESAEQLRRERCQFWFQKLVKITKRRDEIFKRTQGLFQEMEVARDELDILVKELRKQKDEQIKALIGIIPGSATAEFILGEKGLSETVQYLLDGDPYKIVDRILESRKLEKPKFYSHISTIIAETDKILDYTALFVESIISFIKSGRFVIQQKILLEEIKKIAERQIINHLDIKNTYFELELTLKAMETEECLDALPDFQFSKDELQRIKSII